MEQTVHALGINYAQAAGNRQALFDKTLAKRLQPAFAVRSALWAAGLAECGITGPPEAIEGDALPCSIWEIWAAVTPVLSASCCKVSSFCLRQSLTISPNFPFTLMLKRKELTSMSLTIYYLIN